MSQVQTEIEQIWAVEQEILDVIHKICIDNNLRYSLAYGTLLGAVRHGGFIPWDDDIDIMMPREDYEEFLKIWNDLMPDNYVCQNNHTDCDFPNNFSKIRKNNTTFLQTEQERDKHYHKGIFVDVFPGDRVADGLISNVLQYIACAVNLLYVKGYTSGTRGVIGCIERFMLSFSPKTRAIIKNKSEEYIRKWNEKENRKWFFPCTIKSAKEYFPSNLFSDMKSISFCGKEYCCIGDTDEYLRLCYGEYWELPPVEERIWKHHPILIDFERNFEAIGVSE